jgi:hypothetical protein
LRRRSHMVGICSFALHPYLFPLGLQNQSAARRATTTVLWWKRMRTRCDRVSTNFGLLLAAPTELFEARLCYTRNSGNNRVVMHGYRHVSVLKISREQRV